MFKKDMSDYEPPAPFGPEDEVAWGMLPQQIRERYVGPPAPFQKFWLKERQAFLMFSLLPPCSPCVDYWERIDGGWQPDTKLLLESGWVLVKSDGWKDSAPACVSQDVAPTVPQGPLARFANRLKGLAMMDTKKLVVGQEFLDSPLCKEIVGLLWKSKSDLLAPEDWAYVGPCLALRPLDTICILSITEDEFPGSRRIE